MVYRHRVGFIISTRIELPQGIDAAGQSLVIRYILHAVRQVHCPDDEKSITVYLLGILACEFHRLLYLVQDTLLEF